MNKKQNNSAFFKRLLVILFVLAVVFSCAFYFQMRYTTINLTRSMARLDDFPPSTENLDFESEPGETIKITLTFQAEVNEIKQWLASSPGTINVAPKEKGNHLVYPIEHAEEAKQAELTVDVSNGNVELFVEF